MLVKGATDRSTIVKVANRRRLIAILTADKSCIQTQAYEIAVVILETMYSGLSECQETFAI